MEPVRTRCNHGADKRAALRIAQMTKMYLKSIKKRGAYETKLKHRNKIPEEDTDLESTRPASKHTKCGVDHRRAPGEHIVMKIERAQISLVNEKSRFQAGV
mgnify:CR=1 FL=1